MARSVKVEAPDLEEGPVSHLYSRAYHGGYTSPRSWKGRSRRERKSLDVGGGGYFLDSCSLCKKKLGSNRDIFMYRGDMAFCSEECRRDQIERDEAEERSRSSCFAAKAGTTRRVEEKAEDAASRIHVVAV